MSAAPSLDEALGALRDQEDEQGVSRRVLQHLTQVRAYLAELHASSLSGRAVNEANSDLTDRLVRRLYALAEARFVAEAGELSSAVCAIAVGGFSRREMSIHSDVDLLLLYRGELTPHVASVAERLQYWLWDAGLTLGCATRTIDETVALGRRDVTVRTAVLTARFLCGDGEFFHNFTEVIRSELFPDVGAFISEQVAARRDRHARYGESLFLLQPNIKEGAGALRDYHTAYWVARAAQHSTRDLDDLLHFGLLTEIEVKAYREALDFFWWVRNDLHLRAGRRIDQMNFELQEQVARSRGYAATQLEEGELPVERFMGDYYRHARVLESHSSFVIEQCAARVRRGVRERSQREVEDGFRVVDDHLEILHASHLRDEPLRLLSVFEVAQRYDIPLSRMARRMVRENLDLVDEAFVRDPAARDIFLRILDAEHRVMRSLMEMNEVGLLAAYLPEWRHIVCRWQHVIYHTYTVDVHSIFLVEELRRLGKREYDEIVPDLSELIRNLEDRPVLFLGCLLHDIGKGLGDDHSTIGRERARECLERMGLEPQRRERALFLVKHHLRMSHLAQRRDLSDSRMILEFARLCGDRTNLRNLYLLTFADIRASSRDAWTDWKGQLLRELFERAAEFLETGAEDTEKAMERIEARVLVRREAARAELVEQGVAESSIDEFFEVMRRRYFISHTPRQIARHAQVVLRHIADGALATAFREMRGNFTEFLLCTRDVHGLYAQVAGVLMARGLDILGSHVYTTYSGLALEVYRLSTPPGGAEDREMVWAAVDESLARVLGGDITVDELLRRRHAPVGTQVPPSKKPPVVLISNSESDFYTIVDVTTDDHIGLLYELTTAIAEHDLEIYISKASTVHDQVADTFYVKVRLGKKVWDSALLESLRRELLRIIGAHPEVSNE